MFVIVLDCFFIFPLFLFSVLKICLDFYLFSIIFHYLLFMFLYLFSLDFLVVFVICLYFVLIFSLFFYYCSLFFLNFF